MHVYKVLLVFLGVSSLCALGTCVQVRWQLGVHPLLWTLLVTGTLFSCVCQTGFLLGFGHSPVSHFLWPAEVRGVSTTMSSC